MTITAPEEDLEIRQLLELIFEKYSYDFRNYTMSSVRRRLQSAMIKMDCRSIPILQERAAEDPVFFINLLPYLTVSTSEMFRDPFFFAKIRSEVIPVLKTYPSVRVWIAGCSTGEEVYSYAILFKEEGLLDRTTIYATDINPFNLKRAEQGIFPLENVKDYTVNYQASGGMRSFSEYFSTAYGSAMFHKELRENVVFADHSLATDSVFAEVQLVSCRNVLIYFNRELQNRAIGLFYESLSHGSFLALGSKESLSFSNYDTKFRIVAQKEKIYQRV
jgi:chemotaxis protein methyltransferase CheR